MAHKNEAPKDIFVRLLFMFKYFVGNTRLDLALVQPLDVPTGPKCVVDKDLNLIRLCQWPPAFSEFISLQSIIHGALVVPDFSCNNNHFLVDYVDRDMFLQAKTLEYWFLMIVLFLYY